MLENVASALDARLKDKGIVLQREGRSIEGDERKIALRELAEAAEIAFTFDEWDEHAAITKEIAPELLAHIHAVPEGTS
jgi:hypothetical protein